MYHQILSKNIKFPIEQFKKLYFNRQSNLYFITKFKASNCNWYLWRESEQSCICQISDFSQSTIQQSTEIQRQEITNEDDVKIQTITWKNGTSAQINLNYVGVPIFITMHKQGFLIQHSNNLVTLIELKQTQSQSTLHLRTKRLTKDQENNKEYFKIDCIQDKIYIWVWRKNNSIKQFKIWNQNLEEQKFDSIDFRNQNLFKLLYHSKSKIEYIIFNQLNKKELTIFKLQDTWKKQELELSLQNNAVILDFFVNTQHQLYCLYQINNVLLIRNIHSKKEQIVSMDRFVSAYSIKDTLIIITQEPKLTYPKCYYIQLINLQSLKFLSQLTLSIQEQIKQVILCDQCIIFVEGQHLLKMQLIHKKVILMKMVERLHILEDFSPIMQQVLELL